ncbi:hypothetical protein TPDSL_21290 [Terrisporobacter petrolearius]
MALIIFSIFGIFLFGARIEKSKNKIEYYQNIVLTIANCMLLFCKITDYRGILAKIIFIVLYTFVIITYIGSKLKRYKQ